MKVIRNYFFVMMLLSVIVFCSACGNFGDKPPAESNPGGNSSGEMNTSSQPRPDQHKPDLFGIVQSIERNEVTLLVAEMPQPSEKPGEREEGEMPPQGQQPNENEKGKPGNRGEQMLETMTFTGETRRIVISDGTPIQSGGRGGESTELKLSDIQEGMLLQIWFEEGNDGENRTVKNVRVMPLSS